VVGQRWSGNYHGWFPFGLINGLHRIVHTIPLSLAVVTMGSRRQRLYQVRLVFVRQPCWDRHGQNTSVAPTSFGPLAGRHGPPEATSDQQRSDHVRFAGCFPT
jgi:hypothetical protein